MQETKDQVRKKTYDQVKQLFLDGEITNGTAAQQLLRGYWSIEEAGMAISAWRLQKDGNGNG
jgi:hypothetical protein